jgi:hypothetical protein
MIRTWILTVILASLLTCAAGTARADDECHYNGANISAVLKRGINLSNWWQDERNQALDDEDIENLRALGFDFVRLPVSPRWLVDADDAADLHCDIISLLNAGLAVEVDLHGGSGMENHIARDPDHVAEYLTAIWRLMQPVVAGLPADRVLLGLYNEPEIKAARWWKIQGELVKNLRAIFPDNTFVAMAAQDAGPWKLVYGKPYADRNIIYDFHFYEPMILTHHGASWFPSDDPVRKIDHISYPSDPMDAEGENDPDIIRYDREGWNKKKLAVDMEALLVWRKRYHTRVACLEFGIYRPFLDDDSRANWLRDMRELFESRNIPWALWEYRGNFGLVNSHGDVDEGMVKGLGLSQNGPP